MKACSICKKYLDLSKYYKDKSRKINARSECNDCRQYAIIERNKKRNVASRGCLVNRDIIEKINNKYGSFAKFVNKMISESIV